MGKSVASFFRIQKIIGILLCINAGLIQTYAQTSIIIISPGGNESWIYGTTEFIEWNTSSLGSIDIHYSTDGGINWLLIAENVDAGSSFYEWMIPNTLTDSAKVKINEHQNPAIKDISSIFTIHFPINKSPVRILPFGDSITFDSYSDDPRSAGEKISYRKKLMDILRINKHFVDFIGDKVSGYNLFPDFENAGVPGITKTALKNLILTGFNSKQGYPVTPGPYLIDYPADIYLLHIGSNSPDASVNDIEAILDEISDRTPDAWVIVAQILLYRDSPINEEKIKPYNANLKNMVEDRILNQNAKLLLANMESGAGINYETDFQDATHPNENGYNKMASEWYEKIKLLLPFSTTAAPVIEEIQDQTVERNRPYKYFIKASGIEVPTFSLISKPSGMQINNLSGVITWDPISTGSHAITIKAENSKGSDIESFTLQVIDGLNYPDGIISYWRFDETNTDLGFKDLPGVNDAFCSNCPDIVQGKVNNGLSFNNNEVKSFDDLSLGFSDLENFTIEFWVKTDQNSSGEKKIIGKSLYTSSNIWWIGFDSNSGKPVFFISDENGTAARCSVSTLTINDGNWHHIVAVRENLNQPPPQATAKMKLYIDGTLEQSKDLFETPGGFLSYDPLYIGYLMNSDHFKGIIDEVAIYKEALEDSVIQNHYNKSLSGVGYFDDATSVVNNSENISDRFELLQNYPNPFNPITNIEFNIPANSTVRVDVFNIIGEHVMTLLNKEMEAGFYSIPFNGIELSSGMYIYRIIAEDFSQTKKMLLTK